MHANTHFNEAMNHYDGTYSSVRTAEKKTMACKQRGRPTELRVSVLCARRRDGRQNSIPTYRGRRNRAHTKQTVQECHAPICCPPRTSRASSPLMAVAAPVPLMLARPKGQGEKPIALAMVRCCLSLKTHTKTTKKNQKKHTKECCDGTYSSVKTAEKIRWRANSDAGQESCE